MKLVKINNTNRETVTTFLQQHWFTTTMILRGKIIDMTKVEGFFYREENLIIGLITFIVYGDTLEIVSLDSLKENQGIGSALVKTVLEEAEKLKCKRVVLITTNDNINALRFWQKRGFDMINLFHDAMDISRKLKPEIPLVGENNIPLRHEIEFEIIFPETECVNKE